MPISVCAFVEPQQGAGYDKILRFAHAVEEAGFDGLFLSDHYLAEGEIPAGMGPSDAWLTLSALSRDTSRLRLGTLMSSATFRLPGPLAVAAAQLDQMSGGRLEVGLGAGWYEAEHHTHGIPFPSVADRFARFTEQLEILRGLWRSSETGSFSYHGAHYRLKNCPALPIPVQPGGPPLIVGGRGPRRSPAIAARYADEFNIPFADLNVLVDRIAKVSAACTAVGRDPLDLRISTVLTVCCGATEAETSVRERRMEPYAGAGRGVLAQGSPVAVLTRLEVLGAIGLHRVYLQFLDVEDLDHPRLIGAEVIAPIRAARQAPRVAR
ncbi:TIGR03560 family F420-dependent LLM class oxidoreductase [Kribbella sp. NPDC051620]|uniref:TIGR03560 family F420-dependent LLM class oxidoreductase n=1 Tax=Kribbella sp. NPDC051620 TaxID=3364120 RepID=UPI003787519E